MIKPYFYHIFASSILLASAIPQAYADVDLPVSSTRIQRSFVNLSFENLMSGATPNPSACQNRSGSTWAGGYCLFDQKWVEGWKTTASFFWGSTNLGHREIELWKRGITSAPSAQAGTNYAELNAHTVSTLYQNICVSKDDSFTWSLWHMARKDPTTERISFIIADEIQDSNSSAAIQPAGISALPNQNGATEFGSATINSWTNHFNNTPTYMSNYLNGASAKVKAFGFQAKGGSTIEGNWLDNIQVKFKPAIEFSAENGTVVENEVGKNHSVDFNIVGLVTADFDVALIIDNGAVNNPAEYGKDYKIFDNSSGTPIEIIPTATADPKKLSFKYKVKYNPNLNYSAGVKVTGLVIQVINNNNKEGKKVIPFMLDKTQTGIAVMDLRECGGDVFDGFTYDIEDDDVDLSITKKMNEPVALPNDLVSYDMTLFNDSKITAKNVNLLDTLGANLAATANTELTCKIVDEQGTEIAPSCESILIVFQTGDAKTWATQLLSGTGLVLGNVPVDQYFKFTLTQLTVSPTDKETAQNNKNYIINNVEVKTDSSDQNIANNTAVSRTIYAAKNDLSNNISNAAAADAAATGVGMFVIGKDGRTGSTPLWTQKASANAQVYFPLNIQNAASVAQDYQLYASSTAISPTSSTGDYSTLVKSGIHPFTSGLKVEFFAAGNTQCKAGIAGVQQVTQLNVAANSTGEVCAVITVLSSASAKNDIWFAIESLQSGLGDVIRDAVTSEQLQQRALELVNDQTAQLSAGGTYVFSHRLINQGINDEKNITFKLTPLKEDGFLYTLFEDLNKNGILDTADSMILNRAFAIAAHAEFALLVKVQAPANATNGMSSQVKIEAIPDNTSQSIILATLSNTDNVMVSSNQLHIQKMQYKQSNCTAMDSTAVKNAVYSIQNVSLKGSDCLIYRITVKNIGDSELKDVTVNDMYPAYTVPWKPNAVLPMTSTGDNVQDDDSKVKTVFPTLLPQVEKSLYFGIKMQ